MYAAGPEDVDEAVKAARKAFRHASWRDISGTERGGYMFKLAGLLEEHKETLATIETWDNGKILPKTEILDIEIVDAIEWLGKPYQVALNSDLAETISTIKYYAGYADKIHGQVIDTGPDKLAYTIREPVGVCGQIIPYAPTKIE